MHDNVEKLHVVHRDRLFDTLSLDPSLPLKPIVQFDSSVSDKLKHTGRIDMPMAGYLYFYQSLHPATTWKWNKGPCISLSLYKIY